MITNLEHLLLLAVSLSLLDEVLDRKLLPQPRILIHSLVPRSQMILDSHLQSRIHLLNHLDLLYFSSLVQPFLNFDLSQRSYASLFFHRSLRLVQIEALVGSDQSEELHLILKQKKTFETEKMSLKRSLDWSTPVSRRDVEIDLVWS